MRWKDGRRSDNIDDLRGEMGPRAAGAATGGSTLPAAGCSSAPAAVACCW